MAGARTSCRGIATLPRFSNIRVLLIALAVWTAPPAAAQSDLSSAASVVLDNSLAQRDIVFAAHGILPPARSMAQAAQGTDSAPTGQLTDLAPKVAISDVRLGLMQMALAVGPAGQAEIYGALPAADAPALYLREGKATLEDLVTLIAEAGHPDAFRHEGGAYVASLPIIVLAGAALVVRDGERLVFSGETGGFLLSFGNLSVTGATISSSIAQPAGGPDAFRPFVASLGSGRLSVLDSRFIGLGFGPTPALSGLSITTTGLYGSSAPSVISRSLFTDLGGISVINSDRVVIEGNRIVDARQTAIRIDASENAMLSRNVVTGTIGSYAVHLSGPGRGGELRDNVLSGGENAGLRLDVEISEIEMSGNLIEDFRGEGIAVLQGARCVWLHGNVIRANAGNAVRAVVIEDLVVTGNVLLANGGTGLALTEGGEGTRTLVAGNAIAGNRAGIHSTAQGRLQLSGNDLSDQLPRLFTGDLAQHTPLLLQEMRAGGTADLDIWHVTANPVVRPAGSDAGARAFEACQSGQGG